MRWRRQAARRGQKMHKTFWRENQKKESFGRPDNRRE
jgi:hypothetical protein